MKGRLMVLPILMLVSCQSSPSAIADGSPTPKPAPAKEAEPPQGGTEWMLEVGEPEFCDSFQIDFSQQPIDAVAYGIFPEDLPDEMVSEGEFLDDEKGRRMVWVFQQSEGLTLTAVALFDENYRLNAKEFTVFYQGEPCQWRHSP